MEERVAEQVEVRAEKSGAGGRWWGFGLLVGMMVVGAVVRWMGTRNGLWLDEIFSLRTVRGVGSWWDVFTAVHSYNNHYLNTLWMYWVKGSEEAGVLRGFAVVCGVLAIPAAWWLGVQRGRGVGLVMAGMVACSYPLIHFSSEARGYSGAVLGVVVASGALVRFLRRPEWWVAGIYSVGICFGVLSHLTVVLVWVGLLVAGLGLMMGRRPVWKWMMWWVGMNLAPAVVVGWLWLVDVRGMEAMGGPVMSPWWGMFRMMALGMGGGAVGVVAAVGVVVWVVVGWWRSGDGLWVVVGGVLGVMVGSGFLMRPLFFSPRYFLVFLPFVYLAVAVGIVRVGAMRSGVWVGGILMGVFLVGQGVLYGRFLEVGRGNVFGGLQFMADRTAGPFVNLASSQDLRGLTEVQYFGPRVVGKRVLYLGSGDSGWVVPEWYVVHSEGYDGEGAEGIEAGGARWERVGYFGAAELSGQAWTVYRRVGG